MTMVFSLLSCAQAFRPRRNSGGSGWRVFSLAIVDLLDFVPKQLVVGPFLGGNARGAEEIPEAVHGAVVAVVRILGGALHPIGIVEIPAHFAVEGVVVARAQAQVIEAGFDSKNGERRIERADLQVESPKIDLLSA